MKQNQIPRKRLNYDQAQQLKRLNIHKKVRTQLETKGSPFAKMYWCMCINNVTREQVDMLLYCHHTGPLYHHSQVEMLQRKSV